MSPTTRPTPESTAMPTPQEYLQGLQVEELPVMVSVNTVMQLLGISRQMVHRMIERGDLAAINVGEHTVRVFRASLEDYLQRNLVR